MQRELKALMKVGEMCKIPVFDNDTANENVRVETSLRRARGQKPSVTEITIQIPSGRAREIIDGNIEPVLMLVPRTMYRNKLKEADYDDQRDPEPMP